MIEPLRKGEPYPARLPPLRAQWQRLDRRIRFAIVGLPVVLVALLFAAGTTVGTVAAVMVAGVGAASVVYLKNRTDRHNAAVDRGEIRVVADPHLQPVAVGSLDPVVIDRLRALGYASADIGQVTRFDGGWIVKRPNRGEVAVVVGEDGGCAYFDARWVDDLRAAAEYRAGRGREPASP